MDQKIKISVVLITYNQQFKDIAATLCSILGQTFKEFEIIVSDDCSTVNPKEEIETLFAKAGFHNYSIRVNEKNQGTVKNLLAAVKEARGDVIKAISPGDLLFSENTLDEIHAFSKGNFSVAFGRVVAFSGEKEGELSCDLFQAPTDPYQYTGKLDFENLLASQLVKTDWVPGCSLFYTKEFVLKYLTILSEEYGVVYSEDLACPLSLLDNVEMKFYDKEILWYEWGTGISSTGSANARTRMYRDHRNFYLKLKELHGDKKTVRVSVRVFKLREFIMLKTPLSNAAKRVKENHYMKSGNKNDPSNNYDTKYLLQCFRKASEF